MKNKGLFIFFILISWICGRVYIFAPTYYEVKIFQSIGDQFLLICVLSYMIYFFKENINIFKENIFIWKSFRIYKIVSLIIFSFVQLNSNNEENSVKWLSGDHTSALSKISGSLSYVEDFALIIFVLLVLIIYSKTYGNKTK